VVLVVDVEAVVVVVVVAAAWVCSRIAASAVAARVARCFVEVLFLCETRLVLRSIAVVVARVVAS